MVLVNSCQLGRKTAVSPKPKGIERNIKTGWRWTQSRANFSPAKFPANREKYREFCVFSRNHSVITPKCRVF